MTRRKIQPPRIHKQLSNCVLQDICYNRDKINVPSWHRPFGCIHKIIEYFEDIFVTTVSGAVMYMIRNIKRGLVVSFLGLHERTQQQTFALTEKIMFPILCSLLM